MPARQGMPVNGDLLWGNLVPVTVAASPLVSPWIAVEGYTQVVPQFVFVGGTSTHSIEFSTDGSTLDANLATLAPATGTAFSVAAPFWRWKTVQTVADATVSKVYCRARL